MSPSAIAQIVCNYRNVLPACAKQRAAGRRDDLAAWDLPALQQAGAQAGGMSYGDYPSANLRTGVEQLTYLLFLKIADERTKTPYNQSSPIPDKYSWQSLLKRDGDELFDHYRHCLEKLGNEKGLLGLIFSKSQNKFQDSAKLRLSVSEELHSFGAMR